MQELLENIEYTTNKITHTLDNVFHLICPHQLKQKMQQNSVVFYKEAFVYVHFKITAKQRIHAN